MRTAAETGAVVMAGGRLSNQRRVAWLSLCLAFLALLGTNAGSGGNGGTGPVTGTNAGSGIAGSISGSGGNADAGVHAVRLRLARRGTGGAASESRRKVWRPQGGAISGAGKWFASMVACGIHRATSCTRMASRRTRG